MNWKFFLRILMEKAAKLNLRKTFYMMYWRSCDVLCTFQLAYRSVNKPEYRKLIAFFDVSHFKSQWLINSSTNCVIMTEWFIHPATHPLLSLDPEPSFWVALSIWQNSFFLNIRLQTESNGQNRWVYDMTVCTEIWLIPTSFSAHLFTIKGRRKIIKIALGTRLALFDSICFAKKENRTKEACVLRFKVLEAATIGVLCKKVF